MRTFLVSYDLASPARNKHAIATTLMSLGASWARPLEHTWYLRCELEASEIEAQLTGLVGDEDGLLVQAVESEGALTNTQLRWFRHRRSASLEAETNVVAFPSAPAVGEPMHDLPQVAA